MNYFAETVDSGLSEFETKSCTEPISVQPESNRKCSVTTGTTTEPSENDEEIFLSSDSGKEPAHTLACPLSKGRMKIRPIWRVIDSKVVPTADMGVNGVR